MLAHSLWGLFSLSPSYSTQSESKWKQSNFRHDVVHFALLSLLMFLRILLCFCFPFCKMQKIIMAFGFISIPKDYNMYWRRMTCKCFMFIITLTTDTCLVHVCDLSFSLLLSSSCIWSTFYASYKLNCCTFPMMNLCPYYSENMLNYTKILASLLLIFTIFPRLKSSAELINTANTILFICINDQKNIN